ncbi:hypothetical protein [Ignatzschineria sp. LJL83]
MKNKYKRFNGSLRAIKGWAESISGREEDYQEYEKNSIQQYLEGKDVYGMARIVLWDMGYLHIGKALLSSEIGDIKQANQNMRIGINRMIHANVLAIIQVKKVGKTVWTLDDFTKEVAIAINMGLLNLAEKYYHFILEALEQGYSIANGHNNPFWENSLRYSAMIMMIVSDWLGLPEPDLEKYALPKDPIWIHYASHWKEPDLDKFKEILQQVCDVHLERIAITDREFESQEFDFNSPYEALYPVEILFVLRLREMIGLENPSIEHPFMNTSYAKITESTLSEALNDPLLTDFLEAVRKKDPESIALWDNFREG